MRRINLLHFNIYNFEFYHSDLNINEFTKMIKIISTRITAEEIKELFDLLDKDKNGLLNLNEFKKLVV